MPDPTPQQGHVDQLLTNLSVAFMQEPGDFVAPQVFPPVSVAKASDKYLAIPKGTFYRDEVAVRPLGGRSRVVGLTMSTDSYSCEEEGLAAVLDDRERANATPPFDPEKSKIAMLIQQHKLHQERRWAASYFKTGVWTSDLAGQAGASNSTNVQYWSLATSVPGKDIRSRKRTILAKTGYEPNVLVIGSDVELALAEHPDIIDRTKYVGRAIGNAQLDLLAEYFQVDKVLVAKAIVNNAPEGAADSFGFVFDPKSVLLAYAAPSAGLDSVSAGYTFQWTGLLGGGAQSTPAVVNRGREEREHSDWFEVRMAYDLKVVSADLGQFISGAVQ